MFDENAFLTLLGSDAFISVNKYHIKKFGLVEACILGELISRYKYFASKNELVESDGKKWFYITVEDMQELLGIAKDTQNRAIDRLKNVGMAERKQMGIPAKRYVTINIEALFQLYLNKGSEPAPLSGRAKSANKNATGKTAPLSGRAKSANKDEQKARTESRKMSEQERSNSAFLLIDKKEDKKDLEKQDIKTLSTDDVLQFRYGMNDIGFNAREREKVLDFLKNCKLQFEKEDLFYQLKVMEDYQYNVRTIDDYAAFFTATFSNNIGKYKNPPKKKNKSTEPIRKEILPDWFD